MSKVHFFVDERRITVSGSRVVIKDVVKVLCGAKRGEADNRKRFVTCDDCKKRQRSRKP